MCDGRLLASSPFRRLADLGALFRGLWFRWVLHFVLSLTRGVAREDTLHEYGRRCDTLFCLLVSALWLRCNQSLLVQETQSAKDIDLICYKTFTIKATTCLQVDPMSLDWPVDPFARVDQSRSSSSHKIPMTNNDEALFQLLKAPVGGKKMLLNHV